jgi:hypothetical protein
MCRLHERRRREPVDPPTRIWTSASEGRIGCGGRPGHRANTGIGRQEAGMAGLSAGAPDALMSKSEPPDAAD